MRLFYQAKGFRTGRDVRLRIIDENLNESVAGPMNEYKYGIYYIDIVMPDPALVLVFENGEPTCSRVFRGSTPGIIRYMKGG